MNQYTNSEKLWALVLVSQLIGVFFHYQFFIDNDYLSSPFVGDKYDTFMDFFHTMYWSNNEGRYTEWLSVYPPLNFCFLKIIGLLDIDAIGDSPSGFELRECNIFIKIIIGLYLLCPIILMNLNYWKNIAFSEKSLIYLSFVFSIPFLFGLERGNLLILALPFIGILLGNKGFKSILSLSILINLKPYFALLAYGYVCKHNFNDLIKVILLSGLIFIGSGVLLGDENFLLMIPNLFGFSANDELFSANELLSVSSSVSVHSQALKLDVIYYSTLIQNSPFSPEAYVIAISILKWTIILFSIYSISINGKNISSALIFSCLLILLTNISQSVGGYSLLYYLAILPVIIKLNISKTIYFMIFFIFSTIPDWFSLYHTELPIKFSYLSDMKLDSVFFSIGLGTIFRPYINLLLLLTISIYTFQIKR